MLISVEETFIEVVDTSLIAGLWLCRMIVATWQPRRCSYHNYVCLFLQQVWL